MQTLVDDSKDTLQKQSACCILIQSIYTIDLFCSYLKVYGKINEINLFVN